VLEHVVSDEGVAYYASPLLRAIGVPHAFSTRIGGVSPSPFDSMNLGNPSGCAVQDEGERITENFKRLQRAIGLEDRTRAWVHQVHGNRLVKFNKQTASGEKADAVVTACPARVATVRVADCVPILVASENGKMVAAIHAGWRGIVAGVIPAAIAEIQTQLQTSEPATPREAEMKIIAAIGPCIGFDAFEVGAEVLAEFDRMFGSAAPMRRAETGKGFVDLREAARRQLIDAGISRDSIDTTDRCTVAHRDEFFSHRRDRGITGRMAALIGVRA
jgi:YfiH family protein